MSAVFDFESILKTGVGSHIIIDHRNAADLNAAFTGDAHCSGGVNDHLTAADALALDRQLALDGDNGIHTAGGSRC